MKMQSVPQTVLPRSAVFAFTQLCPRMIAHICKPRVPNVHEIFARNVPLYKISGTDRETATHRTIAEDTCNVHARPAEKEEVAYLELVLTKISFT